MGCVQATEIEIARKLPGRVTCIGNPRPSRRQGVPCLYNRQQLCQNWVTGQ